MASPAAKLNGSKPVPLARRPFSVRRTSSIQTFWPDLHEGPASMAGRARDMFTGDTDERPTIIATDSIDAKLDLFKRLALLDGSRHGRFLANCSGMRPGGELRQAVASHIPNEAVECTLLYRLLDDLAGASFMSGAGWYDWPGGLDSYYGQVGVASTLDRPITNLCLSFVPGSEAMTPEGKVNDAIADHPNGPVPYSSEDPLAWHQLIDTPGPNQWRLRRTDLWIENGEINLDAWFQDSSLKYGSTDERRVFHEYGLRARLEPETLRLIEIDVDAHVLPFVPCRAAPLSARHLIGRSVREFRDLVPRMLAGPAGCTHLNDMMRSLQDVVGLERSLTGASGTEIRIGSIAG